MDHADWRPTQDRGLFRTSDLLRAAEELEVPLPDTAAALLVRLPAMDDLLAAIDFLERLCHVRRHYVMSRTANEVLSLSSFAFPVRIRGALGRAGITTIGRLLETSAAQLLEMRNFGHTSLQQLREALAKHGLFLRGEGPPCRRAVSDPCEGGHGREWPAG
jgi:hypothetical protein